MVDGIERHTVRADQTPKPKTLKGLNADKIKNNAERAWEKRTGGSTAGVPRYSGPTTNYPTYQESWVDWFNSGMKTVGTVAGMMPAKTAKTQSTQSSNPVTNFFNKFKTNNNTQQYRQVVDFSKINPAEAEATTKALQTLSSTNAPIVVPNAEAFANNVIYSMNPKGNGKTVTDKQAIDYFIKIDPDFNTEEGKKALETMIEDLKDANGVISCETLQKALKNAVVNGQVGPASIAAALQNAANVPIVGIDGKSYHLQIGADGQIHAFKDNNGVPGEEVPFDANNFE